MRSSRSGDVAAIERLVLEHAHLLDHARWIEVGDLYTAEGRLEGVGPQPIVGHEAFRGWAERRAQNPARRTHHQTTNIRVRVTGDRTATGSSMLVLYVFDAGRPDAGVVREVVAEYRDEYERHDDRWYFARRLLVPLHHD